MNGKIDFWNKVGFTLIILYSVYKSLVFFIGCSLLFWFLWPNDYYLGMLFAFSAVLVTRFIDIFKDSEIAIHAMESKEYKEFEKHFHDDGEKDNE